MTDTENSIMTDKELAIAKLAQELYQDYQRLLKPMYPWIFVRMLPREQKTEAGIIIQDLEQNKPVEEGIVIATWEPFQKREVRNGKEVVRWLSSQFVRGMHVLFPHWAGVPLYGFARDKWRVIKECDWNETGDGGIFARVEYADRRQSPGNVLVDIVMASCGVTRDEALEIASDIEARFLLVDYKQRSVTLSGR